MREEFCGKEDVFVVVLFNNFGFVYSVLGDFYIVKDFYYRLLDLVEKIYGLVYFRVVDCVCNFGIVYSELYLISEVIEYYNKVFEMRKELYFLEYFLILEFYNNVGLMYKV